MDSLGYDLLIDKVTKRKALILTTLIEATEPISLKTLTNQLNISQKTLQQDVSNLIAELPNSIQLKNFRNIPCIEKINNDTSELSNYLNSITSKNPLFIIIESIFDGEMYDIFYFASKFYISESTLKNYLAVLKKTLEPFSLALTTNPINITGNEINLRYFYFQYFRYTRNSATPSLKSNQYVAMYETLQSLTTNYGLVLNLDYYRLASWLLIFEKRVKQKKHVIIPESTYIKYSKKESYLKLKSAILTYYLPNNLLASELNESELMYAYLTRLDSIIYEEGKSFFTDDTFDQFKAFEQLTISFFKEAKRNISLNLVLNYTLQAYLVNLSMLSELTPLFQKVPKNLKKVIEKKYSSTVKIWNKLLTEQMEFAYNYDIAINLTLLSETHLHKKKNVLFALTGESASINYYKEHALKCVPYDMEVFFVFNAPLDNSLLENLNINLCVYNFTPPEELTSSQLFRLSNIPLDSEWDKLLYILHNV